MALPELTVCCLRGGRNGAPDTLRVLGTTGVMAMLSVELPLSLKSS